MDTYLREDDLTTCFDMDNLSWEDDFFAELEETPEKVGANNDSDVEDGANEDTAFENEGL